MAKQFVLPATIGAAADKLYALREKRYALNKQVEALEAEESAIRDFVIKTLPKSQASGVAGRVARVQVEKKSIPQVKNWTLFYAFIIKTKDFSLLQRRPGDAAIKERWNKKQAIPGVGRIDVPVVSLTKK
jgi:hypothetical protein